MTYLCELGHNAVPVMFDYCICNTVVFTSSLRPEADHLWLDIMSVMSTWEEKVVMCISGSTEAGTGAVDILWYPVCIHTVLSKLLPLQTHSQLPVSDGFSDFLQTSYNCRLLCCTLSIKVNISSQCDLKVLLLLLWTELCGGLTVVQMMTEHQQTWDQLTTSS